MRDPITIRGEPVPKNRMRQFHEILCATGGRYLGTPRDCGDVVKVDYAPGDYKAHCDAWRVCTEGITESRKDQWWRKILRRVTK